MAMPTDAINVIKGVRSGPAQFCVMNETSGTFASQVSGGKTLTPGAGCAPNAWEGTSDHLLRGYRNNGGPLTPGPQFDGSINGYASAPGPTIATLGGWNPTSPGVGATLMLWLDSVWLNLNLQCLYAEAGPTTTERLALYSDAGGGVSLRYADASASATLSGGGSSSGGQAFFSGGTQGPRGGKLYVAAIQGDGSVQFYMNSKTAVAPTTSKLPAPAAGSWTDSSINTYVGKHPSVTGSTTAHVAAATQGTTVSQAGANEAGAPLLYIDATSTTGWDPTSAGSFAILVGNDLYSYKTATLLGGKVLLTLTTNLKADVAAGTLVTIVPYAAFRGTLAWWVVYPFATTPSEVQTVYEALTPEPSNGPAWLKSRSGPSVPPRGGWWHAKLDDNAPVHPASAAIVSYWQSQAAANGGGSRPSLANAIPHIDLDHAGTRLNPDGNPAITRDEFLSNPDQTSFLSRMPVADGYDPQGPLPLLIGSDAQQGKTSPKLGLHGANFHQFAVGDKLHEPRAPMWFGRIHGASAQTGGSLPVGQHNYAIATVQANGNESSCVGYTDSGATLFDSTNVKVTLSSGQGTATMTVDVLMGPASYYYKPVALRVYHTQTGKLKDFRKRGSDIPISGNGIISITFTDDGTLTDDTTKRPYGYQGGTPDPTTRHLVNAFYTNGTGTAGSGVPVSFDPITGAAAGNVACGCVPVAGTPVRGVDFPPGTQVAASPAPSQTTFYVTQAALADSGSAGKSVHVTDWTPPLTVYGQMGPARGTDEAVTGGGGTWDWLANPGFLPNWRPSTANNNGPSASSCYEGPGFITSEEFEQLAAGNLHAIDHPLMIAVGVSINSQLASSGWWPAMRFDGGSTNVNATKEGMRLRFPPTFDPSIPYGSSGSIWTAPLSSDPMAANTQMGLAYALRDYGLVIRDSTNGFGFGAMYIEDRPQSGRDPYGAWFGGNLTGFTGSPHILDPIPWAQLQVLRPFRPPSKTFPYPTFHADTDGTDTLRNVSDFTNLWSGVLITGANIAARSTILSVNQAVGTAQLNRASTGTATAVTLTPSLFTSRVDSPTRIIDLNAQQATPY